MKNWVTSIEKYIQKVHVRNFGIIMYLHAFDYAMKNLLRGCCHFTAAGYAIVHSSERVSCYGIFDALELHDILPISMFSSNLSWHVGWVHLFMVFAMKHWLQLCFQGICHDKIVSVLFSSFFAWQYCTFHVLNVFVMIYFLFSWF